MTVLRSWHPLDSLLSVFNYMDENWKVDVALHLNCLTNEKPKDCTLVFLMLTHLLLQDIKRG